MDAGMCWRRVLLVCNVSLEWNNVGLGNEVSAR